MPLIPVARRAETLQVSEIVRISERARQLSAQGEDVISFGTGEPDFPTPSHVIAAAVVAMEQGKTSYPPTAGTLELRTAVSRVHNALGGAQVNPEQVLISTGAKQVLSNAFMATLNDGDEVIVPAPFWTSYLDMVAVSGGKAAVVPCGMDAGFKITPAQLKSAISDKTRWLMINSPSNPSGAMYNAAELAALAEVLIDFPHVGIIADEIYEYIAYTQFVSFSAVAPELADRTLIVNGVSKAYSMTGWRIGWGIGPAPLIKTMTAIQGQSTSGACSISQAAALAALNGPRNLLGERLKSFLDRRNLVVNALNATGLLDCPAPDGAFYVFPACRKTFGKKTPNGAVIGTDVDFCDYLLEAEGVAVVPGRAFGMPGHFRFSYAYSPDSLKEGCRRISRAIAALV